MAQSVITREEARARGLKRYFTGKPCKHGHLSEQYVLSYVCVKCDNERCREARVSNPEKVQKRERDSKRRVRTALSSDPHSRENSIKIARRFISYIKTRALIRNLEFSLKPEDLLPFPKHCPVLGIPLTYLGSKNKSRDDAASIDRIDSNGGYVPENVQIISWRANHIKNDATIKELEAVLKYMKE